MFRRLAVVLMVATASVGCSSCSNKGGAAKGGATCQTLPSTHVSVPWLPSGLSLPAGSYAFAQTTSPTEKTADFAVKDSLHGTIDFLKREWAKAGYKVQVPDVESDEAELTVSGPGSVFVGLRERFCAKGWLFARIAVHPAQP